MTKFDSWGPIVTETELREPLRDLGETHSLDVTLIESVSNEMRMVMSNYAPEFVNAAEGFAENVIYIPVSALGVAPEVDAETGGLGVRPNDVQPNWAEVPLLYLMSLTGAGLIPSFRRE